METTAKQAPHSLDELQAVIVRHWGFRTLRPLQEPAMEAVLAGRDSLVVLPTGGGKSLCYQAPAVLRGDTTVVISPLISLMKDQVDSLRSISVPAIQIDSSQASWERSAYEQDILAGSVRLLFASPERLVTPGFQDLLRQIQVRSFAIDEAHCISHWGHDFRPEYRQLNQLKKQFPQASVHAYTATATERVRQDIVTQLGLKNPAVLVGNFDRPNLTYRILPRHDLMRQVLQVLERHAGEAGIIYCIRRLDVDELAAALKQQAIKALPYHAGMAAEQRKFTQDQFAAEQCDIVVATVAFGMGIDRSNIRFVMHTAMPKSVEHYQQETGRAGRDGLEAECVLLHSGADFRTWRALMEKSAEEANADPAYLVNALKHLDDMDRYCRGAVCRHRALVQYFGQTYPNDSCSACDLCLGDTEPVPDAQVVAQKILSCVARVKERFGINHVVGVLRGENSDKVRERGHDQLSTYGLLQDYSKTEVRDWIYQLLGQAVLLQEGDEYPILRLNPGSWEVMKGQRTVRLIRPIRQQAKKSKADVVSWEGVDRELFDDLRELRRKLALERQVSAFVILSDATLRELARVRPSSLDKMRLVYGIGETKLRDYGELVLMMMDKHCQERGLARDNPLTPPRSRIDEPRKESGRPNALRDLALSMFRQGATIDEVIQKTGRSRSTVIEYLCDVIRETPPASMDKWVSKEIYQRVAEAARQQGLDRLKPIFVALEEKVPYDEIRLVVTHMMATKHQV